MKKHLSIVLFAAAVIFVAGCSSITEEELPLADVQREGDTIFIVDQTGKKWDVTHAVEQYGFDAGQFEFGLGPDAIKPIIGSGMLSPGDPFYPSDDGTFLVIGTTIGGESRAYPIHVLNSHEIVDDNFGDVHVAVGW